MNKYFLAVTVAVLSSSVFAGETQPWSGFYVGINSGVLKGTSTKVNTTTTNTYLYTDPSDPSDPPSNQASARTGFLAQPTSLYGTRGFCRRN